MAATHTGACREDGPEWEDDQIMRKDRGMAKTSIRWSWLWIVALLVLPMQAMAEESGDAVKLLLQKLDKQSQRIESLEKKLSEQDRMDEEARMEALVADLRSMRDELRSTGGGDLVPGWLTDLDFYADVRISYRGDFSSDDDVASRNRQLMRLRFGFRKTLGTDWSAGFGIASTLGNATTQSLTATGYFAEQAMGIDQAWIAWHPQGKLTGLKIMGGKFINPLVHTSLTWDPYVRPEGLFESYTMPLGKDKRFTVFANMAQYIASEQAAANDVLCFAYQGGFDWEIAGAVWTSAVTLYDWNTFQETTTAQYGALAAGGNTTAIKPWRAVGNQVFRDAGDFNIVNLTNIVKFNVPVGEAIVPVQPFVDFVYNFHDDTITGQRGLTSGVLAGVLVGSVKKKGDMRLSYRYAYVEPNAVHGFFSHALVFGATGTNYEGHEIGLAYKVEDNVTLSGTFTFQDPVFDPTHTVPQRQNFQFDVVFSY